MELAIAERNEVQLKALLDRATVMGLETKVIDRYRQALGR